MLSILRRRAYGEVRSKVMLTMGVFLPAELALEIVGYALIAVDLPAEPRQYLEPDPLHAFGRTEMCEVFRYIQRRQADGIAVDMGWQPDNCMFRHEG